MSGAPCRKASQPLEDAGAGEGKEVEEVTEDAIDSARKWIEVVVLIGQSWPRRINENALVDMEGRQKDKMWKS